MERALVFSLVVLALAGCASPRRAGAPPRQRATAETSGRRYEQAPFAGMTKAQALARYGKPKKRVLTEEGERWYYVLNAGEVARKVLNPLVLTVPRYRTGVLVFDANDKLKRFAWERKN